MTKQGIGTDLGATAFAFVLVACTKDLFAIGFNGHKKPSLSANSYLFHEALRPRSSCPRVLKRPVHH